MVRGRGNDHRRSDRLRTTRARWAQTLHIRLGSLTPAELNVVGLVSEGLSNKDIAERLFLSPRTVRRNVLIGDLVQTTDGKWITRPPSRCPKRVVDYS